MWLAHVFAASLACMYQSSLSLVASFACRRSAASRTSSFLSCRTSTEFTDSVATSTSCVRLENSHSKRCSSQNCCFFIDRPRRWSDGLDHPGRKWTNRHVCHLCQIVSCVCVGIYVVLENVALQLGAENFCFESSAHLVHQASELVLRISWNYCWNFHETFQQIFHEFREIFSRCLPCSSALYSWFANHIWRGHLAVTWLPWWLLYCGLCGPRWGRGHRVEGRGERFLLAVVTFCTSVAALCRLLTFVWCVSFGKQSHIMHRSSTLHCDLIRRTFNVDMSVVTSSIRFRNVLDLMSNSYNAPSKICR